MARLWRLPSTHTSPARSRSRNISKVAAFQMRREVELSKNTVADIVKRNWAPELPR